MAEIQSPDYDYEDGQSRQKVRAAGRQAVKRPNPVWLAQVSAGTVVRTNEGTLTLEEDGFVALDEISGHIWPVQREYVEQHYDFVDGRGLDSWPA